METFGDDIQPFGDDKPREECGLFGIYAPEQDVARSTYYGLYALQHRGQESAGIAVSDGRKIQQHKGMGLVSEVFCLRSSTICGGRWPSAMCAIPRQA
jgi:glutamine phosphoribosylpyrophosphate amidotransferase